MIDAYPLSWPAGWPRTSNIDRRRPRFTKKENVRSVVSSTGYTEAIRAISVEDAVKRVLEELRAFNVARPTVIISTNVELRRDGLPRSDRVNVGDPGVAVYWTDPESGAQDCMAIDVYDTVAGNLAAVAATLDAMRAIERHGGAQILKRAFAGFKALPSVTTPTLSAQGAAEAIARRVDGVTDSAKYSAAAIMLDPAMARFAIRLAVSKAHPDVGGAADDFNLVQECKRILQAHHGQDL